jgi:hypothetical protein
MNPRERVLMGLIGAAIAVLLGNSIISAYRSGLKDLDQEIDAKKDQIQKIEFEQEKRLLGMKQWMKAGEQTLSTEEHEARNLLRSELFRLGEQARLKEYDVTLQRTTDEGKNDLRAVRAKVQGNGSLETVLRFLHQLHNQPYKVRVMNLELETLTERVGDTRATRRIQVTGELEMTAYLDTLILPPIPGVKKVRTVDLNETPRPTTQRTDLASIEEYEPLLKKGLFEPYKPPMPKPATVRGPNPGDKAKDVRLQSMLRWSPSAHAQSYDVYFAEDAAQFTQPVSVTAPTWRPPKLELKKSYAWKVVAKNQEGTTEGPVWTFSTIEELPKEPEKPQIETPPPPPPDGHLVVARILSSPRGQQVVLEDPRNRNAEDKRVEIGGEVFGGTLIMVHPKGVVSQADGQRRFHPIGQPLQQNVPLTQQQYPEVFHELAKLEERLNGIRKQPG